jgi:hypothetical protein
VKVPRVADAPAARRGVGTFIWWEPDLYGGALCQGRYLDRNIAIKLQPDAAGDEAVQNVVEGLVHRKLTEEWDEPSTPHR